MPTDINSWSLDEGHFWLRGLRPREPVWFDETNGIWHVYGYPEVLEALNTPDTLSSDVSRLFPDVIGSRVSEFADGNIVQMDPPRHTTLRALVSRAFTPKVVAELEPRIQEITHELLDGVGPGTDVEFIGQVAHALPVTVIAELLGVPSGDRELFKEWTDSMLEHSRQPSLIDPSEEQRRSALAALDEAKNFREYVREHVAERRRRPRNDLLTKLVEAELQGERLENAAIVNFAYLLMIAGHITTMMMLANTVLCLDAHPDKYEEVRTERDLVPAAIEESLRFITPFATLGRVSNHDIDIAGARIPADQMIKLNIGAANRDPRVFDEPDLFRLDRPQNRHLAFGYGIHFCLGAPLARLETRIALNILMDRCPGLTADPDEPPTFFPGADIAGPQRLPMRVPGRRAGAAE